MSVKATISKAGSNMNKKYPTIDGRKISNDEEYAEYVKERSRVLHSITKPYGAPIVYVTQVTIPQKLKPSEPS